VCVIPDEIITLYTHNKLEDRSQTNREKGEHVLIYCVRFSLESDTNFVV